MQHYSNLKTLLCTFVYGHDQGLRRTVHAPLDGLFMYKHVSRLQFILHVNCISLFPWLPYGSTREQNVFKVVFWISMVWCSLQSNKIFAQHLWGLYGPISSGELWTQMQSLFGCFTKWWNSLHCGCGACSKFDLDLFSREVNTAQWQSLHMKHNKMIVYLIPWSTKYDQRTDLPRPGLMVFLNPRTPAFRVALDVISGLEAFIAFLFVFVMKLASRWV